MKFLRAALFFGSLAMPGTTVLNAQESAPSAVRLGAPTTTQQPGGTVTGHVYCKDTQRPARFAEVELLREVQPNAQRSAASTAPTYQPIARGRTALDGSFSIGGVQPGDYYVMGSMTGYVSPLATARTSAKPISGVPMTHVEANRSSDVQVSMERGAAVSGRVLYDDGSPVAGVPVRLRPVSDATSTGGTRGGFGFGGGFGFLGGFGDSGTAETDDRGVFRATGVPPGKYVVTAAVQTESTSRAGLGGRGGFSVQPMLTVYAPGTMHKPEARIVEIRGAETLDGVDMQIALAGLHGIRGVLEAKSDSHPLNSGTVQLVDTADSSLSRTAGVAPDGSFFIEYLPAGNYTLTLSGADRKGEGRRGGSDTKRYQAATQSVVVGDHDVSVDAVLLDEAKSSQ